MSQRSIETDLDLFESPQFKMFSFDNPKLSRQSNTGHLSARSKVSMDGYIQQLVQENLRLKKEIESKDQEIQKLNRTVGQKDFEIFHSKKLEVQLRKSMENVHLYNKRFIQQLQLKDKELQEMKSALSARNIGYTSQMIKTISKYEILKQKYQGLKFEARPCRNPSPTLRLLSPKPGALLNQMKDYISETKTRIRAESKRKSALGG